MQEKIKSNFEWTTGKIWAVALVAIAAIFGITAMVISSHPYVVRIEMDQNTLTAVQNVTTAADAISQRQSESEMRRVLNDTTEAQGGGGKTFEDDCELRCWADGISQGVKVHYPICVKNGTGDIPYGAVYPLGMNYEPRVNDHLDIRCEQEYIEAQK